MSLKITERKKITISKIIYEMLKVDLILFNLKFNKLINLLIMSLKDERIEKIFTQKINEGEEKLLRKEISNHQSNYTLTEDTLFFLQEYMKKNKINDADLGLFIKNIVQNFYKLTRSEREKILYFDTYNKILKLMDKKYKIKIIFNEYNFETNKIEEKRINVTPLAIKVGLNENRNYLLSKMMVNGEYKYFNIKLSAILEVKETDELKEKLVKSTYDEKLIKNFDGYLTFLNEKEVEVKFTDYGYHLYQNVIHIDKPKKSSTHAKNKNSVNLICNSFLAQRYFSKFYEHATIIGPSEIRKEIKERIIKMAENYDCIVFDNENENENKKENIKKILKLCEKYGLKIVNNEED